MQKITKNKTEKINIDSSSKKIVWEEVCKDIKKKLGNNIYESWIKKLKLSEELEHYIVLSAPTRFIRDWVFIDEKVVFEWWCVCVFVVFFFLGGGGPNGSPELVGPILCQYCLLNLPQQYYLQIEKKDH